VLVVLMLLGVIPRFYIVIQRSATEWKKRSEAQCTMNDLAACTEHLAPAYRLIQYAMQCLRWRRLV
jgi:hypothetical protein